METFSYFAFEWIRKEEIERNRGGRRTKKKANKEDGAREERLYYYTNILNFEGEGNKHNSES